MEAGYGEAVMQGVVMSMLRLAYMVRGAANREAAAQLGKGIELSQLLPRSKERLRQEIELQTALGVGPEV